MTYYNKHSSWLDINISDDSFFSFISKRALVALKNYHKIPTNQLSEREQYLRLILNKISCEDSNNEKHKNQIISHIEKRINYFENLNFLYDNEIIFPDNNPLIYDVDKVEKYFFNNHLPMNNEKKFIKRYLNNQSRYDIKNNNNWGELWLEMIDPAHRELDFYKHKWLESKSKDPFFLFLEKQNISHREPYINFILDDELQSHTAKQKNGLLYLNDVLITSPKICGRHNEILFIIDINQNIITGISSPNQRHVSLSRGVPVLGGGLLTVDNGVVKEVKGNSGHYLFYTAHMLQTISLLRESGVQLNDDVEITNFTDFYNCEKIKITEFEKKYKKEKQNNARKYKSFDNSGR
ncbi:MAG: hypothetical protein EOM53_05230 [Alphaproteobacteria bacterium]|nr:hypothetical protein [Alphaproteobacteria bacterium]NCB50058.1 hypothetical protein [Alphaproteobacteria bacterium]